EKVPGKQLADLVIEKKADKQEVSQAGEKIEHTLTVTNTGNVTLTNVMVNDEMLGGDLEVKPSTLNPGETGVVTGKYEVTQDDIDNADKIVNIATRSEEHTSELQSRFDLVCRLLLETKRNKY